MIKEIVQSYACSKCGLCIAACPEKAISLSGDYSPDVDDKCTNCGICLEVCPRNELPFNEIKKNLNTVNFPKFEEELLGPYNRIVLAKTRNNEILKRCYSGGVTTEFLCFLLENGYIDSALLTDREHNLSFCGHPVPFVAKTRDNIIKCADTKPCVNPILASLPADGDRVAFVGVSCHTEGIRKAQWLAEHGDKSKEICKHLIGNISYVIGLNCFFSFGRNGVDRLLAKVSLKEENIEKFFNWKGKPVARMHGGKEIVDFGDEEDFSNSNLGCFLCYPSYSAKLSDITFGKCISEEWGWNDVIVRSEKCDNIISEMEEKGLITIKAAENEKSEILEALLEANVFEVDAVGYGGFLDTGKFEGSLPGTSPMPQQEGSSIKGINRIRLIQAVRRDSFYKIATAERKKRGIRNPILK